MSIIKFFRSAQEPEIRLVKKRKRKKKKKKKKKQQREYRKKIKND